MKSQSWISLRQTTPSYIFQWSFLLPPSTRLSSPTWTWDPDGILRVGCLLWPKGSWDATGFRLGLRRNSRGNFNLGLACDEIWGVPSGPWDTCVCVLVGFGGIGVMEIFGIDQGLEVGAFGLPTSMLRPDTFIEDAIGVVRGMLGLNGDCVWTYSMLDSLFESWTEPERDLCDLKDDIRAEKVQ